ncbi:MAG: hypothetical protein LUH40_05520, partial [Clostridiales bacterium]|nr:hypothetical protein [Clostridiales bacterium]
VSHRPGDINGDGSVTVSDARLCLRYAAKLKTLTNEQLNSAQAVYSSADSYCARMILRAAAKLEDFSSPHFYVDLTENSDFTLDPLYSAGQYFWEYEVSSEEYGFDEDNLVVNVEYGQEIHTDASGEQTDGDAEHYIYNITVTDEEIGGTYDIKCTLRDVGNKDNILDEFTFTIVFFSLKDKVVDE